MPKNPAGLTTVCSTGQIPPPRQATDRYVGTTRSDTSPPPAIASWAIATYTAPGDTVCDPNPGPGVVLAEAVRSGRHAVGLPPQPRWDAVLQANLDLAWLAGSTGTATLLDGIDDPRAAELPDAIDLVLTGLRHSPTSDPNRVLVDLYEDLDAVTDWIWPGGHVVVTCRPWRRHGRLVDLPGKIHDAADAMGLVPAGQRIALTGPVCSRRIRPRVGHRTAACDLDRTRTAQPVHIDVLVFRLPRARKGGGQ